MKAVAEESRSERKESGEAEEPIKLPVPDFEPEKYMRREIESAKLAVLNTGYGILLASVAAVVQPLAGLSANAGWVTLLVGLAGLRLIYRLGGVTVHEWKPKEWLAAYFTLFFSFLAFWYVFSNPPFV